MNYQKITYNDVANGPGIRTTLWVSGCNHHCKGCHNPHTWDHLSGELFSESTMESILDSLSYPYIRGLTLSGGDPLHPNNRDTIKSIAMKVKDIYPNKDIWMWTGYLYDQIKDLELLNYIDVLVDGPFILSKRDITLKYKGSPNQRVIDVKKSILADEVVLYDN